MKLKKVISSILLIIILASQICLIGFDNFVYAAERTTKGGFHYNQLVENAKAQDDKVSQIAVKIYDLIYEMYTSENENDSLKSGNASRDLATAISQDDIANYAKGDRTLSEAMSAARYSFYADYPEIFYVNFSKLTLRVTHGADGYHANIGAGKYGNYFTDGFKSIDEVKAAVTEFDGRVDEIVAGAESVEAREDETATQAKIRYVHNEIINKVSYRYENECYHGNEGFLGTPYGVLVKRQGVCEGYARAFKTVMDKLGITCILVQGMHKYSGEVAVEHMWNYVQISDETARTSVGKWYAVDCTQDDPCEPIGSEAEQEYYIKFLEGNMPEYGIDGFEKEKYLFAGEITMQERHFPNPEVEAAGEYKFEYPELEDQNLRAVEVEDTNGFNIVTEIQTSSSGTKSTIVTANYMGMGVAKAEEQGIYTLVRWYDADDDTPQWVYLVPGNAAFEDKEDGTGFSFTSGISKYIEIAVTDIPYEIKHGSDGGIILDEIYRGKDSALIARSGKIYNYNTNVPVPFIIRQNPSQTATIIIREKPYHITATWGDQLVQNADTLTATITCSSKLGDGVTGDKYGEITSPITFNPDTNTVEFDFKFSQMYADDSVWYNIYIEGVVSEKNGTKPNPIGLGAAHKAECPGKQAAKGVWNLYAKPTLIENNDLSLSNWETSNGVGVSEKLRNRIALVTTKTTEDQSKKMEETLNNAFENSEGSNVEKQEVLSSSTYNIALTICKEKITNIKNGHKITMKVGFPEGYGPENAGVTYKAYHFKTNKAGEIIGVDELDCVVTQYGLIITCDAFSPFTIAAVKTKEGEAQETSKSLILTAEDCGKISGGSKQLGSVLKVNKGEPATIDVTPDEGYEIETLTVCGEVIDLNTSARSTSGDSKQVTVSYDDIKDGNSIVNATFVAKKVAEEEEAAGVEAVALQAEEPTVKIHDGKGTEITEKTAGLNSILTIEAEVSETIGVQTYQWYKDGIKLEGKTAKTLEIQNIGAEHAGTYKLEVTTTSGTVSSTVSKTCNVKIASIVASLTKNTGNKLKPGDEVEVTASINDFKNIGDGLVALSGKIVCSNSNLELIEATAGEAWNLGNGHNPENGKFAVEIKDKDKVTSACDVIKMKFRVKDIENLTSETTISLEEVFASNGGIDIGVGANPEITISIDVAEKVPEITSSEYKVEQGFISRVLPGTTVSSFKNNVNTNMNVVFEKGGKTLGANDVVTTGTILKIGNLSYTISIIGDIDGNCNDKGETITVTDLAQLKLHYIESKDITLSEASLKAADINGDGKITITDLAQLKLVFVGVMDMTKYGGVEK